MTRIPTLALGLLALVTLAACDNKPATPPAAEQAPATQAAPETAAPEAAAPEAESVIAPSGSSMMATDAVSPIDALKAQAASMTPEQKQQAVAAARAQAEAAARAAGQTDAQVKSVGDLAEQAAREALGL